MRKLVTGRWVNVYRCVDSRGEGGGRLSESLLVCRLLVQGHDGQGAAMGGKLATSLG